MSPRSQHDFRLWLAAREFKRRFTESVYLEIPDGKTIHRYALQVGNQMIAEGLLWNLRVSPITRTGADSLETVLIDLILPSHSCEKFIQIAVWAVPHANRLEFVLADPSAVSIRERWSHVYEKHARQAI